MKFVYAGSGFVQVRQHVDNIPGHAGSAYDDTYSKRVKWSIAWEVTIEDERVLVGEPTATVSGTATADKNSGYGLGSCSGPVKLPVVAGKPFIPTSFDVIDRTQQFLTVRMGGTGAFGSFPVAWAASPSCLGAENITGYVTSPGNGAGAAWGKSWGAPEFKIALFNNYKITPFSIGNTYPFPVALPIKKIVFDWNARLTIAGYGSSNPNPPPKPPTKKPCQPSENPFLDDAGANIYLNEIAGMIPGSRSGKKPPWDSAKVAAELEAKYFQGQHLSKERFGIWLECSSALYRIGARAAREPLNVHGRNPMAGLVIPSGDHVDIRSSPDVLDAQLSGDAGGLTNLDVTYTANGLAALGTGKPLPVTLTATFRAKGKPPITVTKKITFQGQPPVAVITSVTFNGSQQNPAIVVHGRNLGNRPAPNPSGSPSNKPPLCPVTIQGNAGLDYGTSLYLSDDTRSLAAGRYRPSVNELDCVGLIVTKFTPTEVDYRFGSYYAQVYPQYAMQPGDTVQVVVNGATKAVHVKYGATVTS